MSETKDQEKVEQLEQIANEYDQSQYDKDMRYYMWRTLRGYMGLWRHSALEVGCYLGWFTQWLHHEYSHLTIVEPCQDFIHATANVFINGGAQPGSFSFYNGLFENYDPDTRFSAIFMVHTLEHFDDPVAMLARAKGMLSPGGRIFLVVPNAEAVSRRLAVKMGLLTHLADQSEADIKHGHQRVYSMDTLERDCRAAGLNLVHTGGIFFKALANFQIDGIRSETTYLSPEYMEACYQLGKEYPSMCASIYAVCEVA